MSMRFFALPAGALLMVACAGANDGREVSPGPSQEVASCDSMVRVDPKVSVMFKNEWMNGALVLAVCRGTPAESADLSPLMTWLKDEAHAGRMRSCWVRGEKVSPEEMTAATQHLPGLRDWCFLLVSDI
jgi:hypothetical protein